MPVHLFSRRLRVLLQATALCIVIPAAAQVNKARVYIPDIKKTSLYGDTINCGYNGGTCVGVSLFNPVIYNQLKERIPSNQLSYLVLYSRKDKFPAAMQQLNSWDYDKLKPAFFYAVAPLKFENYDLLLVEMPAAENRDNKKLSDALKPATDIYFITQEFYTYPGFDVSGSKQYNKKNTEELDRGNRVYKDYIAALGNNKLDTSLFFKTTVPVSSLDEPAVMRLFAATPFGKAKLEQMRKDSADAAAERILASNRVVRGSMVLAETNTLQNQLVSFYNNNKDTRGVLKKEAYDKLNTAVDQVLDFCKQYNVYDSVDQKTRDALNVITSNLTAFKGRLENNNKIAEFNDALQKESTVAKQMMTAIDNKAKAISTYITAHKNSSGDLEDAYLPGIESLYKEKEDLMKKMLAVSTSETVKKYLADAVAQCESEMSRIDDHLDKKASYSSRKAAITAAVDNLNERIANDKHEYESYQAIVNHYMVCLYARNIISTKKELINKLKELFYLEKEVNHNNYNQSPEDTNEIRQQREDIKVLENVAKLMCDN